MKPKDTLRDLVDIISSHKLWSVAASAFTAILWLVVPFLVSLPARLGESARNSIRLAEHLSEYDRAVLLMESLRLALSAHQTVFNYYTNNVAGRPVADAIDPTVVADGLRTIADARVKVAVSLGRIQGVSFYDPALERFRGSFESDLRRVGETTEHLHAFYTFSVAGEHEQAMKELEQANSEATTETAAALVQRLNEFSDTWSLVDRKYTADTAEARGTNHMFYLQIYAVVAGFGYLVGFTVLLTWTLWGATGATKMSIVRRRLRSRLPAGKRTP